jgi:hypothetical protein
MGLKNIKNNEKTRTENGLLAKNAFLKLGLELILASRSEDGL